MQVAIKSLKFVGVTNNTQSYRYPPINCERSQKSLSSGKGRTRAKVVRIAKKITKIDNFKTKEGYPNICHLWLRSSATKGC